MRVEDRQLIIYAESSAQVPGRHGSSEGELKECLVSELSLESGSYSL